MAERTLVAALIIKAVNQASGPIRQVSDDLKRIQKQSAEMREVAAHLAVAGTAMTGAGLGMAYGLTKVVEPAMQVEDTLHRIANSLPEHTDKMKALSAAQAAAEATSNRLGISQTGLLKQIYLGTSAGLNMAESIAAMKVASEASVAANGDLESMQRTLNLAYINFKDPSMTAAQNIQNLGNIMVTAAEKFDYKDINELREQLELATPTAKATGTEFKDLVATLADFTRHGLTGSVAGAAFEEGLHGVLVMQQKLGIQIAHNAEGGLDYAKSLQNVRDHFIRLYGSMKAIPVPVVNQLQSAFGIRGIRALLIDKSEVMNMRQQLDTGLLTTQAGAAERMSEAINQVKMLKEAFTNMAVDIGTTVLPTLVKVVQHITPLVHAAADFAKAHPQWVKMAVVATAIASALLLLGGFLALATASILGFASTAGLVMTLSSAVGSVGIAAKGVTAAQWLLNGAVDEFGVRATLSYRLGRVATLAWSAATKVATAAQWLFNAALDANPIGIAIVAAAAFAGIAYEVYEHWSAVKEFFTSFWRYLIPDLSGVKGAFALVWSDIRTGAAAIGSFFKQWGLEILGFIIAPWTMLPYEIYKHWGKIKDAATSIAHGIARLFVGHSPIPEGPLHDLNLGRQIALSLHPAELAGAARRAAAGIAVALPLAMASPVLAAAAAPTLAMSSVGRPAASASTVIHYEPRINISGDVADRAKLKAEVLDLLRAHSHELAQILNRDKKNKARLEF